MEGSNAYGAINPLRRYRLACKRAEGLGTKSGYNMYESWLSLAYTTYVLVRQYMNTNQVQVGTTKATELRSTSNIRATRPNIRINGPGSSSANGHAKPTLMK
jgi:hypothetical protein